LRQRQGVGKIPNMEATGRGPRMQRRCLICIVAALIGLWSASAAGIVYRGVTGNIFWGQFGIWLGVISVVPTALLGAAYIARVVAQDLMRNERLRAADIAAIVLDRARLTVADEEGEPQSLRIVEDSGS